MFKLLGLRCDTHPGPPALSPSPPALQGLLSLQNLRCSRTPGVELVGCGGQSGRRGGRGAAFGGDGVAARRALQRGDLPGARSDLVTAAG